MSTPSTRTVRRRAAWTISAVVVFAAQAAARPQDEPALASLAALVAPWVDQGFFPGVVVGVARGEDVWIQGFGETAPGSGEAPDRETIYELGSLSKVYTGLLLADAHLRGTARLQDTLVEHLPRGTSVPEFEGLPIRLVHLSTHTSGLGRLPSNLRAGDADPYAAYDAKALYAGLAAARTSRAPGARYAYSNFAVGALGHALARAEGVDTFQELCVARLCVIHGLDDTRVSLTESQRARLAPPFDAALQAGASWGFDALAAAGGLRASSADLVRFGQLFVAGAAHAHAAACALTLEVHARPEGGPPMGLGWHHALGLETFEDVVAHEGQTGGYHTVLLVAPKERIVVTVLVNSPCDSVGQLGVALLRAAHGEPVEPRAITPRTSLAPEAANELPGKYKVGFLDSVTVTAEEGGLYMKRSNRPKVRLNAVGVDRYEPRVVAGEVQVQRDEQGKVTGLLVVEGKATATALRE
ncbi:MAG: serine hydrolase domain-containing protein [Planctomycetota bacterium]